MAKMRYHRQESDSMWRRTMDPFLLCLLFMMVSSTSGELTQATCDRTWRRPEYTDIAVDCGTTYISLAILACPVVYTGYNESLLILNQMEGTDCKGTLDETVNPPVVRFTFPINSTTACGSIFMTTSSAGTGPYFEDISNIQTVNVSGVIRSHDPTTGTVTYNAELKYFYSCAYPLEYFINNTQIDVSSSSIAVKDNNGSFISTLNLELFTDNTYTTPLVIPPLGLELRTPVFVQVQATNLTSQYNVLLDRCYASLSAFPSNSTVFNLFVSVCSKDSSTDMLENGDSQNARFSFPAFRFIEQQNLTVSTYYLHCITRLCEISTCSQFKQCRKRRDVSQATLQEGVSESTTISSSAIITKSENMVASKEEESSNPASSSSVGLGITVGVLAAVCVVVIGMAAFFYKRLHPGSNKFFQN